MSCAFSAAQWAALNDFVNVDPAISPASINVENVEREVVYNESGHTKTMQLAYITQGDESIYVDDDGASWDYDILGLEILKVKEPIGG
jgi:hypothetical protein